MGDSSPSSFGGSLAGLAAEDPYPGLIKRTFDSEGATVNSYEFEPGAEFPLHHHRQEQITLVTAGEVEMTVGEQATKLLTGDWNVIPGGIPHGITAGPEGASILAIIVPRRDSADSLEIIGSDE